MVTSRCAKCLEPVELAITAEMDALFSRQPDPDDPDLYTFEGSKADLTDAVRDALLLELPYRFLCSEDCKGLCPSCGTNFNLGRCDCKTDEETVGGLSALAELLKD